MTCRVVPEESQCYTFNVSSVIKGQTNIPSVSVGNFKDEMFTKREKMVRYKEKAVQCRRS